MAIHAPWTVARNCSRRTYSRRFALSLPMMSAAHAASGISFGWAGIHVWYAAVRLPSRARGSNVSPYPSRSRTISSVCDGLHLRWRSGGVKHPHDTPPYPLMPSPTFDHSSRPCTTRVQGRPQRALSIVEIWRSVLPNGELRTVTAHCGTLSSAAHMARHEPNLVALAEVQCSRLRRGSDGGVRQSSA